MGTRQSSTKKNNAAPVEVKPPRVEFDVTQGAVDTGVLALSKPIYQRLQQFLTTRETVHLASVCKLANNHLFHAILDCYDVSFPLFKLVSSFSQGYWKLGGMSVKLLEGEKLIIPSDAVGALKRLRVTCQLVDLNSLIECNELQTLIVTWCRDLVDVSGIRHCINLQSASLVGCIFTDVSAFAHCSRLHTLDLSGAEELKQVNGLGTCPSLKTLRLHNCSGLIDVSGLSSSTSLTNLNLSGCINLSDISPLSTLISLKQLNLSNNSTLTDVSRLIVLPSLINLDLSSNRELKEVNVLANCPVLEILNLSCCFQVTDWSELSRCATLQTLSTGGLVAETRSSVNYSTTNQRFG